MWFHELNPYRCAVLRKNFPGATIIEGDIAKLSPADVPDGQCHFFAGIGGFGLACEWARFDGALWTGGFPCQDVSCAGKGAGLDGERSGLWFEWLRLIRARRPVRLLIENVPALRPRGYDRIHDALGEAGYSVWPIVVGAEAVACPLVSARVWIVAQADEKLGPSRTRLQQSDDQQVALLARDCLERPCPDWREVVSAGSDGGMDDGVSDRVDRVEALGDSIVPQVAAAILRAWKQADGKAMTITEVS